MTPVRDDLPTGTVTFLFTDVEGSTRLLDELGEEGYAEALAEHRCLLREAFRRHGGAEVDTQGDAFFYAFADTGEAVAAAAEAQAALAGGPMTVRMGLHTGEPRATSEGYVGREVHRAARIAAAGHGCQVLLSKETRELIDDEVIDLGEHRLKDFAEPVWIFQLGSQRFPPLKSISNTNLPRPASAFVGRERELDEVTSLLQDGARLLTLTGPGGSGKTRLAIEAAAELVPQFKAGVFWVGLAPLRDPAVVLEAIAQTLGAKDGLADHIANREILLLLDNLEQVVEVAPELASLVESCPNLRLLVTSRELLRVRGEVEYAVPPLTEPEAVTLFCERARAEPDETIAELCRRLDKLPLALELAAARARVLTPAQILERLSKRLDLLKGGRDVEARQQTLRATIEWSYDLLDEQEQLLFERLSVVRGGCTLEAAEEISEADIDTLQSLIDKSLLRRQGQRFWMLETIRDYAAEQLERRDDAVVLANRHADYFIALAEAATRGFPDEDVDQGPQLYPELDNFRRALAWLVASGDVERELRLAISAFWCLWTGASLRELHGWLASALGRAAGADAHLRADALGAAALAAANLGKAELARTYARESLGLARERDDKRQIEWALRVLSFDEPDADERRRLLGECERLLRELGNDAGLGWVTFLRGMTFVDEGRTDLARETLEQATALFRTLGRRWEATNAEKAVGFALVSADRRAEARPILEGALASAVEIGSSGLIMEAVVLLAAVRMEVEPAAATRLLAWVHSCADKSGRELDPRSEGRVLETEERRAREQLGERFEAEWQAGSGLMLEEAVALALEEE
jgi:predicted ATPase